MATLAPSLANSRASAAPMPRAPPLMIATFPSSLPIVNLLKECAWSYPFGVLLSFAATPLG